MGVLTHTHTTCLSVYNKKEEVFSRDELQYTDFSKTKIKYTKKGEDGNRDKAHH